MYNCSMNELSYSLRALRELFFPRMCPVCGKRLEVEESFLCGKCVEIFHHRRALAGIHEGLDPGAAEGVHEVSDLLVPKRIVHLQLILLPADTG